MPYMYWKKQVSQCKNFKEKLYALDDELNENHIAFHVKIDRMLVLSEECLDDLGSSLSDSQYESVTVWDNKDEYKALLSDVTTLIDELEEKIDNID